MTIAAKVYDGTTTATIVGGRLDGVINSDTVTFIPGEAFLPI